ncbi:MAG: hypothetical protein V7629_21545, partial [Motiliproteus sp.]
YLAVVLNIIFSIVILEIWLRLENKVKSKSILAFCGMFTILICGCLAALLYYSVEFSVPNIPLSELKGAVLAWSIVILIYLIKCFSPRRRYNKVFNIEEEHKE